MKRILLDTNAYVAYLSGDERVLNELAAADIVYMSIFVLGELNAGFRGGKKFVENKKILERFLSKSTVETLDATFTTADIFGQIKNDLKKTGRLIPINDVWIAAHALETGSVLLSYDRHFLNCAGIRLWDHLNTSPS